jgi:hypothetical protein
LDRLLKNAESVFPNADSTSQYFTDSAKVKVIGIDLGEVFTVASCRIDSVDDPSVVRNMTIKRTALYQPTLKARHELEGRKPAYVRTAEHSIPSKKRMYIHRQQRLCQESDCC